MVVMPARALVVEVRLGQRGGIGLARPAILLLAAIGGPGASQSAGGPGPASLKPFYTRKLSSSQIASDAQRGSGI